MRIVVLVKHVPDPATPLRFDDDHTLDRDGAEGRLSQLDEYAIEQAMRLAESGAPAEITCLTMGPAQAVDALRKALAMGGEKGVHVVDDALHGSDAMSTSLTLAEAIRRLGFDLVVCGMASTDAEMSVIPALLAARLGVPSAANVTGMRADDDSLIVHRETEAATEEVVVLLPAVVSVSDRSGEPRYPSFKAIMGARKKPVETWSLADLAIAPDRVGLAAAATVVRDIEPCPPRGAGTVVVDKGLAAVQLADFLADHKLI